MEYRCVVCDCMGESGQGRRQRKEGTPWESGGERRVSRDIDVGFTQLPLFR